MEDSLGAPSARGQEPPDPYEIDADVIHLVGDRLFQARGRVEVINKSLQSYADSLEFQQDIGWVTLFDNARVISQDTVSGDNLDLRGDTITMSVPNDQIDEMESRGRAQLLADEVDVRGPWIRLVFQNEELDRVFALRRPENALGPGSSAGDPSDSATASAQPIAMAEDFRLTGDSIEAALIEGELDEVVATGSARGVSTARDSLNTDETNELIRNDWIEGDTITATFGSVPVAQTNSSDPGSPESETGTVDPQALELNYVIGDQVRLFMRDGEVERMEVDNPTGVNLQPRGSSIPPGSSPPPGGNGGGR